MALSLAILLACFCTFTPTTLPQNQITMSQRKSFFKDWLEKLQQESWQLELIISGIAILGLREVMKYLDTFGESMMTENPRDITIVMMLLMIKSLYFGASISLINLVVHVLIRSLWIGAIGLRYVSLLKSSNPLITL